MVATDDRLHEMVMRTAHELRDAYVARDMDRLTSLFADDAEITLAPGTFRGKAAVRTVLEWDASLSPTVRVSEAGIGTRAADHCAVMERTIHLMYRGIPYDEHAVTIIEIDDIGHITRYRSYYDKLDVMDQIASKMPGLRGAVMRRLIGYLVATGRTGLSVDPA